VIYRARPGLRGDDLGAAVQGVKIWGAPEKKSEKKYFPFAITALKIKQRV
jgi:hypothetical protein